MLKRATALLLQFLFSQSRPTRYRSRYPISRSPINLVVVEQLLRLGVDSDDELLVADFPIVEKANTPHRRFRVFELAESKRLERRMMGLGR